ncbi:MAG: DUF4412 domain-containing protein [Nitrospinae bacterium]|nr:DUF4412 domain-containing protein [Nitrospinota bacterium]
MKKGIVTFVAALSLVLAAGTQKSEAAAMKNFSADMVVEAEKHTSTMKFYIKADKQRMESSEHGASSIMIMRFDRKVMWMVDTANKSYMEMPVQMDHQNPVTTRGDANVKVEKKLEGTEKVDGHPTNKYFETYYRNGKKEGAAYIWEATDLDNFPIKYQDEQKKATTTFKNIKLGDPADSLFDPPAGYQKMDMGGMMGGMGGRPHKKK